MTPNITTIPFIYKL